MKTLATTVLIYALLILIGGWMGHVQSGSQASLIAGVVCGTLLLISSLLLFKGRNRFAAYFALILTFLLDGFFTYRFSLSLKFFPAGMMSLVSLITLLLLAYQMRKLHIQ